MTKEEFIENYYSKEWIQNGNGICPVTFAGYSIKSSKYCNCHDNCPFLSKTSDESQCTENILNYMKKKKLKKIREILKND